MLNALRDALVPPSLLPLPSSSQQTYIPFSLLNTSPVRTPQSHRCPDGTSPQRLPAGRSQNQNQSPLPKDRDEDQELYCQQWGWVSSTSSKCSRSRHVPNASCTPFTGLPCAASICHVRSPRLGVNPGFANSSVYWGQRNQGRKRSERNNNVSEETGLTACPKQCLKFLTVSVQVEFEIRLCLSHNFKLKTFNHSPAHATCSTPN